MVKTMNPIRRAPYILPSQRIFINTLSLGCRQTQHHFNQCGKKLSRHQHKISKIQSRQQTCTQKLPELTFSVRAVSNVVSTSGAPFYRACNSPPMEQMRLQSQGGNRFTAPLTAWRKSIHPIDAHLQQEITTVHCKEVKQRGVLANFLRCCHVLDLFSGL